jgi:hypothetical protein
MAACLPLMRRCTSFFRPIEKPFFRTFLSDPGERKLLFGGADSD